MTAVCSLPNLRDTEMEEKLDCQECGWATERYKHKIVGIMIQLSKQASI